QELRNEAARLRKDNIDPAPLIVEINEKLTLAFSCLVFVLLGVPLAMITRRREKSINIGIAILIMIVYYPMFIGCEALGIEGFISPAIIMWTPNLLLGSIGAFLTYKLCAS
ncbi:MAG: LptF/LptG family permease, partial [Candidatus Omnitrophica bacterium]|nr:LptF/LptG family permease [Candidatus Omnitrophota bacterium]